MIYSPSLTAILVFAGFVAFTLGLSFYFGGRTRSAAGYFAAGGQIHWFVNGVAFAGDFLSAASFLGICGMIAFYGYDGFLYSIGFLAGWIVALFVVAEPMKRLGRYTFADALNARFQSRGIRLAAGVSSLVVSLFYLIPQMVGAGALVRPLLGLAHWQGVCIIGVAVVLIVVTAGMVSTTYVQFLKGGLLVFFSLILTAMILNRGLSTRPETDYFRPVRTISRSDIPPDTIVPPDGPWTNLPYVRTRGDDGRVTIWREAPDKQLWAVQTLTVGEGKQRLANGLPQKLGDPVTGDSRVDFIPAGNVQRLADGQTSTGPLTPFGFLRALGSSEVLVWREEKQKIVDAAGATTIYYPQVIAGSELLTPGNSPMFAGLRGTANFAKLNFLSFMLALFCGTASLPHILIRYYTVKDQASARKSTVVGIGSIGFFYVLTLFIGLGAMTGGVLDVTDSKGNMAAPLLARSFGELPFALISAIAFTTVLGTVAGLIVAASGAFVHDLLGSIPTWELTDHEKVRIGRLAAVVVGVVAIALGILFEKFNVAFLVAWAFSVAASANLPSLAMMLFWRGTTRQGIIAGVVCGMLASLGWILLSGDTFKDIYGLPPESSPMPFSQPGLVTIPLGFVVVWVVSLATARKTS